MVDSSYMGWPYDRRISLADIWNVRLLESNHLTAFHFDSKPEVFLELILCSNRAHGAHQ